MSIRRRDRPRARRRRRIVPARALPDPRRAGSRAGIDYGAGADPDWRSIDWPGHLHRLEVLGRPVSYVDLGGGDGPDVLLELFAGFGTEGLLPGVAALTTYD